MSSIHYSPTESDDTNGYFQNEEPRGLNQTPYLSRSTSDIFSSSGGKTTTIQSPTTTIYNATVCSAENPNNCTTADLAPPIPLERYRLNNDPNPHVIRKKPCDKVHYTQQITLRYLKPPEPAKGGDIVIRELPHKQVAPAPPLVVRQAPQKPVTPPPLIIRECPPTPPPTVPGKTIHIPGKLIPPPARKVIVEKLPPIPQKPQQVFIERWLPYEQQQQKVVFQPAKPPCVLPDPKNVVIQWEAPEVEVKREVTNLGVYKTDPYEYLQKYGGSLLRAEHLPDIAHVYADTPGVKLASKFKASEVPALGGDISALRLIDLDKNGLSHYRNIIEGSTLIDEGSSRSRRASTFISSSTAATASGPCRTATPNLIEEACLAASLHSHDNRHCEPCTSVHSHRFIAPPCIHTRSDFIHSPQPPILTKSQTFLIEPSFISRNSYSSRSCRVTKRSYLEKSTSMVIKRK